ncbi:hypothetical protein EAX61_09690 [Dokdonia sinensis]|uniref:ASPIC/UnbV domain-containing protein n=1 Tax=Dokdonia sinensis TaxID=2479847 RepID=A0A3M0GAF5_9FLAO|nr:FG-GAP-like repeat-containing protein [Dokdonia sinensis]RMB58563.1 hypothetical protein EAX61_09690 [Dokdonia sinensis]
MLFERYKILLLALFLITSCKENVDEVLRFRESVTTNITFSNTIENTTNLNILNYLYFYNGAGTAVTDFDGDGLKDIYFTSNARADELYLNQGNLEFKNVTSTSGISNVEGWTTGVTIVDINNDTRPDLYISKVSGHLDLKGHNLLYINQGIQNGKLTFTEEANKYGLDFSGYGTQAVFFDYDLDGDLDAYLLNHSVHPNSNYGRGTKRKKVDSLSGDKLLKNDNGTYTDISKDAGIYQSIIGYGLGISVGDLNDDGHPDIYVGNDFFENDYLYINQQDGTFKEVNSSEGALGHSTHFSMGNSIADLNNDGLQDIFSVDMLPDDLKTLKASGTEYPYPTYQNQLRSGYQPQFMQNTLHLNRGNGTFSETAFQSGISATEWSWAPLTADFDNDGNKDIFITNGIQGATNDMDFINFISNESIQKRLGAGMKAEDLSFTKELPQKKTPNYLFKNKGNGTFEDVSNTWMKTKPSFSNGASYADLDNDGDLDIIINNVNERATILENRTTELDSINNYLNVSFSGPDKNRLGIGAKVIVYHKKEQQLFENYTTTGYLSAVAPEIHVGLGAKDKIDSLKVIWPDKKYETIANPEIKTSLTVSYSNASGNYYKNKQSTSQNLISNTSMSLTYNHEDGISFEFDREPLVPYASTNRGGKVIAGDLNNDTLDDLITLGAKGQETKYWLQNADGTFVEKQFKNDASYLINEDIDAIIFDANGDKLNDIVIVSGGNEIKSGEALQPRLYLQQDGTFTLHSLAFQGAEMNASSVTAVDYDNDSDLDVVITSNAIPQSFGAKPKQFVFNNDGNGNFIDVSETFGKALRNIGNVQHISWVDMDGNGFQDAIVSGHWMPITILLNDGKRLESLENATLPSTSGWWNTHEVADFDNDGDLDIFAGNWGLNTRLTASAEEPLKLYRNDFDDNGKIDPILTYFYKGEETVLASKDELVKQLPFINKEFLSYNAFAKAELTQLFPVKKLKSAEIKEVQTLASVYIENLGNGDFKITELPFLAQVSSVYDFLVEDFNKDGFMDVILVGNDYEISTQLGRLDGSQGLLLLNNKRGFFEAKEKQDFNISGASRSIKKITINDSTYYVVGRNNDTPLFLKKEE